MTAFFLARTIRWPLSALAAILALTSPAWADDISNQPLASLPNVTASPNLQIVMDTSGSMLDSYMPDEVAGLSGTGTNSYGYYSVQCNGVAYDPTHAYIPAQYYDGTYYANSTYGTAAWDDGYKQSSGTTSDLTGNYYFTYSSSGTATAMGWTYNPTVVTTTTFYKECASKQGVAGTPGASVFTKVLTSSLTSGAPPSSTDYLTNLTAAKTTLLTTAQKTNYANWYSYYSKRYLLMRTAMGQSLQAFNPRAASATPGYRVGFNTIYYGVPSECKSCLGSQDFIALADFTSTQMSTLYDKLYSVAPAGGTNLPDALAEAGHFFAHLKKLDGTDPDADPMQYACQRNYALLTTDGYWNINSKDYQLGSSTRVGNQDSTEDKPRWDGTHNTVTTTTVWTAPATQTQLSTKTATITWTLTGTVTSKSKVGGSGTNKNNYAISQTTQTYDEVFTQVTSTPQTATASKTETKVVTDGAVTSDTFGDVSYSAWTNGSSTTTTTDAGPPSTPASPTSVAWTPKTPTPKVTGYSTSAGTGIYTYSQTSGSKSSWSSATVTTVPTAGPNVGTFVAASPSSNTTSSGGSSDTLADVAEYYYKTDLRDSSLGNCGGAVSSNVCLDIVPATTGDTEKFQHMNTFTIGLGVNGTLPKTSDTLTGLTNGTIIWPVPTAPSGAPTGSGGDATNVDDLWHAALNGRGQYFSALTADQLSSAISSVINSISAVKGAGSGSSTSSLALVAGDNNQIYTASYTTSDWTGDVIAQTLNGDGTIKPAQVWSASDQLDTAAYAGRKIYFNSAGTLTAFTYANLTTAQKAYFDKFCGMSVVPSQCTALASTPADLTAANTGTNLVNYLRGDRTYETAGAALASGTTKNPLYRPRKHVLGDIIDGAPVYVGKPPFSYADAGYSDFVSRNASRTPVIYTAANDGMLHAFSAASSGGGSELWAFVPTPMMPNLYQLANAGYSTSHRFFVDGAPVEGDAYLGGTWKTILVGGFDSGGQGYYALDITDPANPRMLWEFSDANMGLSYGNPIITKNAAGTWVVVFSSGYSNTGGDGNGHLYVVDAATGAKLQDIPTYTSGTTGAGASSAPSNLGQINAWIDVATDNTSLRFYGGDMLGNVWRFDTDNRVSPHKAALLLATLKAGTTPQPITTKPETVAVNSRPAVVVSTGRYLGSSDIADKTQQSMYVITDNLDTVATWTGWGNPRTNTTAFSKATVTVSGTTATITPTGGSPLINFTDPTFGGWYMDLPHSGERVFTNMVLSGTELTMTTAIPSGDACTSGGSSWVYYINVGSIVGTAAQLSDQSLIVGVGQITDSSGNVQDIFNLSNGDVKLGTPPQTPPGLSSTTTRASWRELAN